MTADELLDRLRRGYCPDGLYRGCDLMGCDRKVAARLRGELLARCDRPPPDLDDVDE